MTPQAILSIHQVNNFQSDVIKRSDRLMNYILPVYFCIGLLLAAFYDTWLIALGVGGISLLAYFSVKIALPDSALYQYVLSGVIGVYMAQFIYQMHGMFEMHFFALIGSALLITYQKWKLQIPLLVVVFIHHCLFSYLQDLGYSKIYFSAFGYFDFQTFLIHLILTITVFIIGGLWAYQFKKYNELHIIQSIEVTELRNEAQLFQERQKIKEVLVERNEILESIGDAFFAIDKNWIVTYWNHTSSELLNKPKGAVLGRSLLEVFPESIKMTMHQKFADALRNNSAVHFNDFNPGTLRWFEVSAYPSKNGLSVYFKDITESLNYIKEIEEQNKQLIEISWMQSHLVRAPLVSIMGLIPLIKESVTNSTDTAQMLDYLSVSANKLDEAIHNITDKSTRNQAGINI